MSSAPEVKGHGSALVAPGWVEDHLGEPAIRLIEVGRDLVDYRAAHVPGAVGWHAGDVLHAADRRDIVGPAALAEALRQAGVSPETTVVVYGSEDDALAAFAYWVCRHHGFERVRIMDGGMQRWKAEDRPIANDVVRMSPADPGPFGTAVEATRIGRDALLARVSDPNVAIVDVRSPAEFSGEMLAPPHLPQEGAQRAGHIPGAVNIPWGRCVIPGGGLRPLAELSALFSDAGVSADRDVIVYCRVGDRSAHTWLVLHEVLGYPRVANYDGSWTEYGSLVGVPVDL
jgi:thiosulfate/3-mercaptopyruvate sulfurtransferase